MTNVFNYSSPLAEENLKPLTRFTDVFYRLGLCSLPTREDKVNFLKRREIDPYLQPFIHLQIPEPFFCNADTFLKALDIFVEVAFVESDINYTPEIVEQSLVNLETTDGYNRAFLELETVTLGKFLCRFETDRDGNKMLVPDADRIITFYTILDRIVSLEDIAFCIQNLYPEKLVTLDRVSVFERISSKLKTYIIQFDGVIGSILQQILRIELSESDLPIGFRN